MERFRQGGSAWVSMPPPLGNRRLRLLRSGAVLRTARALRPDVVIERYYNFGGEGLLAARRLGALAVLEVNAPVIDHPGSAKQWLDRLLIVQPLRRWRDWQCRVADLIVTPSARILPDHVPAVARAADRMGRRYRRVSSRRHRRGTVFTRRAATPSWCLSAPFARGTAPITLSMR